jgi:glycosyltransferase involved in cell wall biosynthesis
MRKLVECGVEVHVALPFGGPRIDGYRDSGIEVHDLSYPVTPVGLLRNGSRLRSLHRRIRPDVIHSWFAQTTLYGRLFLRGSGTPRIFQVPGPLHLESPLYRRLDIRSANRDDWWIGTSRFINDLYRKAGVPAARLRLAYAPADLSYYVKSEPGWLRGSLDIPEDKKIVGMVAVIYPPHRMLPGSRRGVKGHEDLIDAFALLRERRDDVVLVIVGGAWEGAVEYENRIRAYAHERCGGNIAFTGWIDDVRKVFADLDVFVHPPRSENLGGVFESLLLEVPTVASNVGGIPEAVIDGQTGVLVDATNHRALADEIDGMLNDTGRAAALAKRGRQHILRTMDLDRSIQVVLETYRELAARG